MLIVESSALVARGLADVASRFGFEPVFATDFHTSIDAVLHNTPAFIVTAIELEGMPGPSLISALRACPKHRVIPAVFVSSSQIACSVGERYGCPVFEKKPDLRDMFAAHLESIGFEPGETEGDAKADALRGRHLLVAEDMDAMRRLLSHKLHIRGAKVTLAQDGFEASVAGLNDTYDLIVLDIEMPRLDGRDVIKLLRDAGVKTPIVALTAHTDDITVKDLQHTHGFDDVIPKPDAVEAIIRDMQFWDSTRAA